MVLRRIGRELGLGGKRREEKEEPSVADAAPHSSPAVTEASASAYAPPTPEASVGVEAPPIAPPAAEAVEAAATEALSEPLAETPSVTEETPPGPAIDPAPTTQTYTVQPG